ncbi:MAG TPA: bacteriohopanetetrol glucosamine biosynthesis glycosyltransferase HpnI [Alphaproteobacteria bacterium]|nr:bacteriohopanetetrol glucosamine biosynthesis glycosyltransferase HpnI [Alphaproteobacteria bacterium]
MFLLLFLCTIFAWFFIATAVAGSAYQLLAAYAVRRFVTKPAQIPIVRPPVTLLKPLCGDESGLYQNLRTFCELQYPGFQIVFGVRDPDDPAISVVERLQADLPKVDIALVVDPAIHGTNYKVSNLINMMAAAKHDVLVLSDSDMHVDPHYLDAVVGTLQEPGVGVATCLYTGAPTKGFWSALGGAGINYWFLPSATVSKLLGGTTGCYGATIALRRETLETVGGFQALKNQLADDYALGAAVEKTGKRIAVVPHLPSTTSDEPTFGTLYRHELRWARTIRNTAPLGFAGSAITYPVPLALIGAILGSVAGLPDAMLLSVVALAVLCRSAMIALVARMLKLPAPAWWLFLPRDVLSLVILIMAFLGRSVSWRNSAFRVDSVGALSKETDGI